MDKKGVCLLKECSDFHLSAKNGPDAGAVAVGQSICFIKLWNADETL